MLPFVFESVESHVFADFEDMSTVVLEDLLEVVESEEGEFGAAVDEFEAELESDDFLLHLKDLLGLGVVHQLKLLIDRGLKVLNILSDGLFECLFLLGGTGIT